MAIACHTRTMLPHRQKKKKRKDYTFWHQFNEKPSIIPGCPGLVVLYHSLLPKHGHLINAHCFQLLTWLLLQNFCYAKPVPFVAFPHLNATPVCPLASGVVSRQLLETELTGLHCRSLVIADQATQTAALNADLLVELLSQSCGPQKRESTAANLLPASGEHYAQVRYHPSCIGHAPSLMHRSCNIAMHGLHTISHV